MGQRDGATRPVPGVFAPSNDSNVSMTEEEKQLAADSQRRIDEAAARSQSPPPSPRHVKPGFWKEKAEVS